MVSRIENKSMRLAQIEALLLDHPAGLTQAELARRLGVHRSTIQRNLADMSSPVYEEHGRIFIDRESYLVNLNLSLHEAFSLHLAGRFMSNCIDRRNPHIASALRKLGISLDKLAPLISQHIRDSANNFDDSSKRDDPHYQQVLEKMTIAWAEERKVQIWYCGANNDLIKEYVFCPYFVEVGAIGQAIYVIGQIEPQREKRTFKIDRVVRIELLKEAYSIPPDFDPQALLHQAWGIWFTEADPVRVKLRFSNQVAQRVMETRWHLTEQTVLEDDGSLTWSASISEPREMFPWIRGWGSDVEVIEPPELRDKMKYEILEMADIYK